MSTVTQYVVGQIFLPARENVGKKNLCRSIAFTLFPALNALDKNLQP